MSEIQGVEIDIARKDEIPQEFTTEQMNNIKANIPTSMANVNIVPYHIYDEDEHQVGEWRQVVDGVKKKKPVYEKLLTLNTLTLAANTTTIKALTTGGAASNCTLVNACGVFTITTSGVQGTIPGTYSGQKGTPEIRDNEFSIAFERTGAAMSISNIMISYQYTKTSDQWSLV